MADTKLSGEEMTTIHYSNKHLGDTQAEQEAYSRFERMY